MHIRKFASGDLSGKHPAWYWKAGLHDAEVIRAELLELDYDYRQRNPLRNALVLHLDASGALFDKAVTAIELRNYKILLDESSVGGYSDSGIAGCYWMQDILKWEQGNYILEITLLGEDDFRFTVQFEDALVTRK